MAHAALARAKSPLLGIVHRPGPGCLWPFFGVALGMTGPAGRAPKGVVSSPC